MINFDTVVTKNDNFNTYTTYFNYSYHNKYDEKVVKTVKLFEFKRKKKVK